MSNILYTVKWSQAYSTWESLADQIIEQQLARSDMYEANALIEYIKTL